MKPVCTKCQRFFRCKKTGFYWIEGMPVKEGVKPGTQEPENWKPYKLWAGDRFECEGCGASIVVGVPSQAISEHFHEDFQQNVDALGAGQLQVNDC